MKTDTFIHNIKNRTLYLFDKLTSRRYQMPHWICIGVPKAGTTSLYHCLKEHPQIWMPTEKETQFFSSPNFRKGMKWYLNKFYRDADPNTAVGELSPKYFIHKHVPKRIIQNLDKNIKFLILLRNPVDRAWSHYCHSYKVFHTVPFRPTEDLTFEEALEAEADRLNEPGEYGWTHHMWNAYYYTGLYAMHLKNWLKFFDRRQFLIITLEDLIYNTIETLNKITEHLNIENFSIFPVFRQTNTYSKPGLKESTRNLLIERYKPHNRELSHLLGRNFEHWDG